MTSLRDGLDVDDYRKEGAREDPQLLALVTGWMVRLFLEMTGEEPGLSVK